VLGLAGESEEELGRSTVDPAGWTGGFGEHGPSVPIEIAPHQRQMIWFVQVDA
jgi:hypothetical protein